MKIQNDDGLRIIYVGIGCGIGGVADNVDVTVLYYFQLKMK
jgi:hypothetical protein